MGTIVVTGIVTNMGRQTNNRSLLVLGTRGIPALHGGFETFAEHLALAFVKRGWDVAVYCQLAEAHRPLARILSEDKWNGVRRILIRTGPDSPLSTMSFDWTCTWHAMAEPGLPLVLGYNTAIFSALLRLRGRPLLINMDGMEWKRRKWPLHAKTWLYVNERCGALAGTKLIADHPVIADHLAKRRSRSDIVTIPYGAASIMGAPVEPLREFGIAPSSYYLSVGRIEPENSILEMITAFSKRPRRSAFVCVGPLDPTRNIYHARVMETARGNVHFPGAIYDRDRIRSLRFHALAYCHGHTVGGTNPSLVEALGAGNAVVAHDNAFNRWVAGDGQFYFRGPDDLDAILNEIEAKPVLLVSAREKARQRFAEAFSWNAVFDAYEELCRSFVSVRP